MQRDTLPQLPLGASDNESDVNLSFLGLFFFTASGGVVVSPFGSAHVHRAKDIGRSPGGRGLQRGGAARKRQRPLVRRGCSADPAGHFPAVVPCRRGLSSIQVMSGGLLFLLGLILA